MNANVTLGLGSVALCLVAGGLALGACGGGSDRPAKWPPLPAGCPVTVLEEAPTTATDNIGPVSAKCTPDIAPAACERTLADQACKLGADTVWGVTRIDESGWYRLFGRAAHTTSAK